MRDRNRHWTGGTVLDDREAVILAPLAVDVLETEIAWVVRAQRPLRGDLTEARRRCRDDRVDAAADREDVRIAGGLVARRESRGHFEPRNSTRIDGDVPREIGGAQAELPIVERIRGVVGLIDENTDRDRRRHDVDRRKAQRQLNSQRFERGRCHEPVSVRRYPTPRTV